MGTVRFLNCIPFNLSCEEADGVDHIQNLYERKILYADIEAAGCECKWLYNNGKRMALCPGTLERRRKWWVCRLTRKSIPQEIVSGLWHVSAERWKRCMYGMSARKDKINWNSNIDYSWDSSWTWWRVKQLVTENGKIEVNVHKNQKAWWYRTLILNNILFEQKKVSCFKNSSLQFLVLLAALLQNCKLV